MLRASYLSRLLSLCLCLCLGSAHAQDPREEFRSALQRAESGESVSADSDALRAYVLYPYLQAVRLRSALRQAPGEALDTSVADFLKQAPAVSPVRELRRAWLNSLADRNLWPQFLAQYEDSSDIGLRCHRLTAWLETGGLDTLKNDALQIWMTGQQLAQSCTRPFTWLQDQGELTAERKEQRAQLALAAGNAELAEWLIQSAPPERRVLAEQWIRLLRQPKLEVRVLASRPELPTEWAPLRDAYAKLVRGAAADGQELLPQLLKRPLTEPQRLELRMLTALALAWDRRPEALAAFRDLPDAALDARSHEWRVRAALWAGDWTLALDWLQRLPPELATQPRWSYWRARALDVTGQREAAAAQYAQISGNHWYALLASWRLRQPYAARNTPSSDDAAVQAQLLTLPTLQRARELFLLGRLEWANSEWNSVNADLTAPLRVQAARLAASWGWTLQAAAGWKRAEAPDDLAILYPRPFQTEMTEGAARSGLPVDWLYAIARQESLFLPLARSRSDALGLLQIKLDTAHHVARRAKWPLPTREQLFQPTINAPLGAAYLTEMFTRFQGHPLLAVGAYNAGPGAVTRWLTEQPVEPDVWVENVPFNETRDYIQKVIWNAAYYSVQASAEPVALNHWLTPIRKPLPQTPAAP